MNCASIFCHSISLAESFYNEYLSPLCSMPVKFPKRTRVRAIGKIQNKREREKEEKEKQEN